MAMMIQQDFMVKEDRRGAAYEEIAPCEFGA
jgi:hypothetical protein